MVNVPRIKSTKVQLDGFVASTCSFVFSKGVRQDQNKIKEEEPKKKRASCPVGPYFTLFLYIFS